MLTFIISPLHLSLFRSMEMLNDSWTPIDKNPQQPKFTFPDADIERGISLIVYGCQVIKWTRYSKSHQRTIYLDPEKMKYITWVSPDKDKYTSMVELQSIKFIFYGKQSKFFAGKKHNDASIMMRCASISYKMNISDTASLNIEFMSKNDLHDWSKAFEYLIIRLSRSFSKNIMDDGSMKELWINNINSAKDIKSLLVDMNIHTTDDLLQYHGSQIDKNNEKKITLNEFKELVGSITSMYCIAQVFKKYQDVGQFISLRSLQKFYEEFQEEKRDPTSCINDIVAFSNYTLADYEDINKIHKTHSVCLVEDISKHHDRVLVLRKKYDEIINNTISIEKPKGLNIFAFSKLMTAPNNSAYSFLKPTFSENSSIADFLCKSVAYPYLDQNKRI